MYKLSKHSKSNKHSKLLEVIIKRSCVILERKCNHASYPESRKKKIRKWILDIILFENWKFFYANRLLDFSSSFLSWGYFFKSGSEEISS